MTTLAPTTSRRNFWCCLFLLVLALPLAVFVQSKGEIVGWVKATLLEIKPLPPGSSALYAQARFRSSGLESFDGPLPKTKLVAAKLDITLEDVAAFKAAMPCEISLLDAQHRRFKPLSPIDGDLRKRKPEWAEKPDCNSLIGEERAGHRIEVVETYLVPDDAKIMSIYISMAGIKPQRLVLAAF